MGLRYAEKVRKKLPEMPFIFLTARSLKEDIVKGLRLGAEDYITKPFDPEVLILKINNILKRVYTSLNDTYEISSSTLHFNTLELKCGRLDGKAYPEGGSADKISYCE